MQMDDIEDRLDVMAEFVKTLDGPEYEVVRDAFGVAAAAIMAVRDWYAGLDEADKLAFVSRVTNFVMDQIPRDVRCTCDDITLRRVGCQCEAEIAE